MPATRSSLLRRVRNLGDRSAWREFDTLYRPLITGYALRAGMGPDAAEEITQQCLAAIVAAIHKFQERVSFRAWLRGMVRRKIADYLADRSRHRRADTVVIMQTPDDGEGPDELWEKEWNRAHLLYCVESLRSEFAEHTFEAFVLYVLHSLPVPQISTRLGMTPNQIYVAKSRVLQRIRERFHETLDSLYGVES